MESKIIATIATSLMPRRIDVQQAAVKSWMELGFQVLSLNVEAERAVLAPLFEGVEFTNIHSNSTLLPHISIAEILRTLESCRTDICGIVNSDIILSSTDDFISFIWDKTEEDAVIFGPRIDVDNIESRKGSISPGYDYFFFRKKLLPIALNGSYTLGGTWWDYWFPISLAINGIRLRYFLIPVGFHPKHPQIWSESDFAMGRKQFISAITETWRRSKASSVLSATSNSIIEQAGAATFAETIPSAILFDSDLVVHTQETVLSESFPIIVNALGPHIAQYQAIIRSKSWRWTHPVRQFSNQMRIMKKLITKIISN